MENEELEVIGAENMAVMASAEMNDKVDIAKRYPRDIVAIKKRVLQYATCDRKTAEGCFYVKPVGDGKNAEGKSIRMAELAASCFTNIQFGSRIISIEEKFVTVQGIAFDMENNITFIVEVKRSIWTDKGRRRYGQNMIETTTKAASAIAVRDAIFKVIPMSMFNQEMEEIKKFATGAVVEEGKKVDPLLVRVQHAAFFFLDTYGVSGDSVLAKVGKKSLGEVTEDDLVVLTGLKQAIKQKESTVEEAFPLVEDRGKSATSSTSEMLKKKA